jgi:vacuolar-type H+-ATPase subunit E/Vma4
MISFFSKLQEDEQKLMFRTPVLVSILIAGADDKFEKREISRAINLARSKLNNSREILLEYYKIAVENFDERLMDEIDSLPSKASKRNPVIIAELEKLNNILPKLDRSFAIQFYESIRDIARQIATSSGGFLGYLTIHPNEKKLMELNMIKDPAKNNR